MAKRIFHKVDEMFEMISWTPCEEKILTNLLIDFKENGKLNHCSLQGEALIEINSKLSVALEKTIATKRVEKKFMALSARYDLWKNIRPSVKLKDDGKFEASNATWDAVIKQYPFAKRYKHQPEPLWVRLDIIFGQVKRKEELRKATEFIKEIDKLLAPPIVDTFYDVDKYVKDEQSAIGRDYNHILPLPAPSVFSSSFGIKMGLVGTSGMKSARFDDDDDELLNFHQLVRV